MLQLCSFGRAYGILQNADKFNRIYGMGVSGGNAVLGGVGEKQQYLHLFWLD
ncbi:hypothetical protein [Pseudovibrio japonicus]|uniref:hypothetical protein n=1 Tax=Pseudovibrio japonicus TaxID=366534 RepID=UPI0016720D3B|nr:hypothetical protein [Pseudovibrio japonicus]